MKSYITLRTALSIAMLSVALSIGAVGTSVAQQPQVSTEEISDAQLVASLPGFKSHYSEVNGVRLHYVAGGRGQPLFLLPGWPQTWWSYHKVMPDLAKHYRVIAIDIRGMGASSKPQDGYEKKNMAKDIHALAQLLGYKQVNIVGHDIGAQVAWSFAANYPQATKTLTMLDVPHPDEGLMSWPILPGVGTFGDRIDPAHPFVWWFAFHQVKGLPEDLLEGRASIQHEWFFRYLLKDDSALDARDRAVYANAYNSRDGIRAGNAWYQAFPQDIVDEKAYGKLQMPVLGIAGPGYGWLNAVLTEKATNSKVVELADSGHFIAEEKPAETIRLITEFVGTK